MYVPRDEAFSKEKQQSLNIEKLRPIFSVLVPLLMEVGDSNPRFPSFTAIDFLYNIDEATVLKLIEKKDESNTGNSLKEFLDGLLVNRGKKLLFEPPEMIKRDKFSWLSDVEFARQTLAGVNPMSIELVKEFPFVSKLDPKIYGPPESEISKELVEREIKACMTLEEAIKQKKLFVLYYHDLLLPFVNKVRELEGTTLYGSRTLFFLTEENTLRPIAIELTRPASPTKPQWKRVFTPSSDATNSWLWKLAKIHVCAHDSGYHELVIHWLRTHCCTEPYIIAANRQLSVMHPIYRLLHPHLRYTMAINAFARKELINAGGIIESSFSARKYSMELSSVAYDKLWRFDMQALPADLINRGMAVEDTEAEHGVRLTIEDYPFASDGLLIWSATKQWVSDYVNHYYQDNDMVSTDDELQEWLTEVRTRGHEDKKDEAWWPTLKTRDDLIKVLTTIIWVASAHHAAVNFGQYSFGGYFLNRPSIARTNLPVEEDSSGDFERFLENPDAAMLECFPSPVQAITVIAALNLLSGHSADEEYLGGLSESAWSENTDIYDAYKRFQDKLKEIETTIDARNADKNLRNRAGAGIVPYQLLKPFSKKGVTGMGIPNSISI